MQLSVDDFLEICKASVYEDYTLTLHIPASTPLSQLLQKAFLAGTVIAAPEGAAWGYGKYQGECIVVAVNTTIGAPVSGVSEIMSDITLRSVGRWR